MKKMLLVRSAKAAALATFLLTAGAGAAGPAATEATGPAAQVAVKKKIDDPASLLLADANKLIASRKDLVLIDVRSPLEFGQGFIANSQNIPFIDIMEGRHAMPKDRPLLLICSIGGRSFAAVQLLLEKGYTQVYNLDGGINGWRRASLPLQTGR